MPDFSAIIKRSWETAKHFKWLWIYGAVLGSGSMSGSRGYSFGGSGESEIKDLPENGKDVLGAFTTPLLDWLKSVPISSWILLASAIILAIAFGMIVKMILTSWAQGALIHGVYLAHLGDSEVSLKSTSPKGIKSFWELIKLSVLLFLVVSLFVVIPVLMLTVLFATGADSISFALGAFAAIVSIFLVIPLIIITSLISVFAQRAIVIHELDYKSAFKKAWIMLKSNKKASFLMGLINVALSSIIGFAGGLAGIVILGIPAFFTVYPSLKSDTLPGVPVFVFLALLFVVFLLLMSILGGFVNVFKYSNWNQLYYWAVEKDNGKQKGIND